MLNEPIGNTSFDTSAIDNLVDGAAKKEEAPAAAATSTEEKVIEKPAATQATTEVEKPAAQVAAPAAEIPVEKKEVAASATNESAKEEIPVSNADALFAELKEKFGISTREELDVILSAKPKVEETPEQIEKRTKLYNANLDKYLQENNLMSREAIIEYEGVKKKSDTDLAIDKFKTDFKAENPDADDDDIEDAVESRYHLKTENPKHKKIGEFQIKQDAKLIRSSFESAYTAGKNQFDEDQATLAQIPQFNSYLDAYGKSLPAQIKAFEKKDDNFIVNFDLTPEVRKDIVDTVLRTPEMLQRFAKHGDTPEFKALVQQRTREAIILKNFEAMTNVVAEANHSKGLKSGSTVGAKQPFAVVDEGKNKAVATKKSKEDAAKEVVESAAGLRS